MTGSEVTLDGLPAMAPNIVILDVGANFLREKQIYQRLIDLQIAQLHAIETPNPHIGMLSLMGGGAAPQHGPRPVRWQQSDGDTLPWPTPGASPHYLRIGTIGEELNLLRQNAALAAGCVAVQVHTCFISLNRDEPATGSVDKHLRALGLEPVRFVDVKRWRMPMPNDLTPVQLLQADTLYLRRPIHFAHTNDEDLLRIAIIAHVCVGRRDVATRAIETFNARRRRLAAAPPSAPPLT